MERIFQALVAFRNFLNSTVITFGTSNITLWALLYVAFVLFLLVYVSGKVKNWIVMKMMAKSHIEVGVRMAAGSVARYCVITIGFVVVLQTAGIDMSAFTVLAGALGVGVGFGLQNITNNFVSGIIILLERPIKVTDRVQVGEIVGDIVKISPRATTIVTNDDIAIIIPNSEFISSSVTNWSYNDRNIRLHVRVGVSYDADPQEVKTLLLEVAGEHRGVLDFPATDVVFEKFGDSSLDFDLRVWTHDFITKPSILISDLNFAIQQKFKSHGVEIPYPQRDVHIRSAPSAAPAGAAPLG